MLVHREEGSLESRICAMWFLLLVAQTWIHSFLLLVIGATWLDPPVLLPQLLRASPLGHLHSSQWFGWILVFIYRSLRVLSLLLGQVYMSYGKKHRIRGKSLKDFAWEWQFRLNWNPRGRTAESFWSRTRHNSWVVDGLCIMSRAFGVAMLLLLRGFLWFWLWFWPVVLIVASVTLGLCNVVILVFKLNIVINYASILVFSVKTSIDEDSLVERVHLLLNWLRKLLLLIVLLCFFNFTIICTHGSNFNWIRNSLCCIWRRMCSNWVSYAVYAVLCCYLGQALLAWAMFIEFFTILFVGG